MGVVQCSEFRSINSWLLAPLCSESIINHKKPHDQKSSWLILRIAPCKRASKKIMSRATRLKASCLCAVPSFVVPGETFRRQSIIYFINSHLLPSLSRFAVFSFHSHSALRSRHINNMLNNWLCFINKRENARKELDLLFGPLDDWPASLVNESRCVWLRREINFLFDF